MKVTDIYTNAVDLAKKIQQLNNAGRAYKIEIVKGINNESVVKLTWIYVEED